MVIPEIMMSRSPVPSGEDPFPRGIDQLDIKAFRFGDRFDDIDIKTFQLFLAVFIFKRAVGAAGTDNVGFLSRLRAPARAANRQHAFIHFPIMTTSFYALILHKNTHITIIATGNLPAGELSRT
jgi:hypothetical protein